MASLGLMLSFIPGRGEGEPVIMWRSAGFRARHLCSQEGPHAGCSAWPVSSCSSVFVHGVPSAYSALTPTSYVIGADAAMLEFEVVTEAGRTHSVTLAPPLPELRMALQIACPVAPGARGTWRPPSTASALAPRPQPGFQEEGLLGNCSWDGRCSWENASGQGPIFTRWPLCSA